VDYSGLYSRKRERYVMRVLNYTIILILVVSIPLSGRDRSVYLSLDFAKKMQAQPGGKELPVSEQKNHKITSWRLLHQAYRLYRQKKDWLAVKRYQLALEHHATGALYYHYGNSLSNLPGGLPDALTAYRIAYALGYKNIHLIYYNIACAYSRKQNEKSSRRYLEMAVKAGYRNFRFLAVDNDLAFLRETSGWKKLYTSLKTVKRVILVKDKYSIPIGKKTVVVVKKKKVIPVLSRDFRQVRWGDKEAALQKVEKNVLLKRIKQKDGSIKRWYYSKIQKRPVLLWYMFKDNLLQKAGYDYAMLQVSSIAVSNQTPGGAPGDGSSSRELLDGTSVLTNDSSGNTNKKADGIIDGGDKDDGADDKNQHNKDFEDTINKKSGKKDALDNAGSKGGVFILKTGFYYKKTSDSQAAVVVNEEKDYGEIKTYLIKKYGIPLKADVVRNKGFKKITITTWNKKRTRIQLILEVSSMKGQKIIYLGVRFSPGLNVKLF